MNLLGVQVDALSIDELHQRITASVRAKSHSLVLHVNAHGLNLSYRNTWMRDFLNQAATVLPDGVGVAVAARILGHPSPRRIPITDWIWDLAGLAASEGFSLYLLGGQPGIAERAADRLRERHPDIQIIGVQHGYFEKARDSNENNSVVAAINRVQPDILLVGFGMPIQEQWLRDNWAAVDAHVGITGGAVMDYTSGALRRGPAWLTSHGLEWLARLVIEPRRLWRRYVVGNPVFLVHVLQQRLGVGRLTSRRDLP